MKTHCEECKRLCCSAGCLSHDKCMACRQVEIKQSLKFSDFPTTCCSNISGPDYEDFQPCDESACHFYLHNEDICSYCEEHNYVCGEQLNKESFR